MKRIPADKIAKIKELAMSGMSKTEVSLIYSENEITF